MSWTVKLDSKGRILIPKELRETLRVETGETILVELQGDLVILKSLQIKKPEDSNVDKLQLFLEG